MFYITLKQTLDQVINHFERKPEKALFTYEARTEYGDGLSVIAKAQQFAFKIDEPRNIGGKDQAPKPTEYALAALGACHSIVYKALALKEGIEVDEVKVDLKAVSDSRGFFGIDPDVRPGFQKIELETEVTSGAPVEKLEEIFQQVEKLCPVNDIIANRVPITQKVAVQNSKGEIIRI